MAGALESLSSNASGGEKIMGLARLGKGRLGREWRTVAAMVRIYCRHQHACSDGLCPECQELLDYAAVRLDRCRFGPEKPTCAKCPVHCYQRDRREQMKNVMRFAGPRMLWSHPLLSLHHWWDGLISRFRGPRRHVKAS